VKRVLLVTSALHMERALAVFRSSGLDPIPAPTDYRVTVPERRSPAEWLPAPDALSATHAALWERAGLLAYRLRGWVDGVVPEAKLKELEII
jgi:uncharacterized SAM-binding protein YcdF (DUF218 family)